MTVGDTLLKISDFPFAYSVTAITFFSLGYDISANQYLFLAIAGFLASSLVIIDPAGKWVRKGLKKSIFSTKPNDVLPTNDQEEQQYFLLGAMKTRSIALEIDKIVNFLYFVFTMLVFVLAISFSGTFVNNLVIPNTDGVTICDKNCVIGFGLVVPTIITSILIIEARNLKKDLFERLKTTAFYSYCIDLKTTTRESMTNFSKAIEQNDWQLANWWKNQVNNEIDEEAGLQEQRQKIQIEILEKKLEVYGSLLTMIEVSGRWQNVHGISLDKTDGVYIFVAPAEESKFSGIFEKSNYLLSREIFELFLEYAKTKNYKQGLFPGTNQSQSYVVCNLANMQNQVNNEYKALKNEYKKITGLDIV